MLKKKFQSQRKSQIDAAYAVDALTKVIRSATILKELMSGGARAEMKGKFGLNHADVAMLSLPFHGKWCPGGDFVSKFRIPSLHCSRFIRFISLLGGYIYMYT